MKERILLVEDEISLSEVIKINLEIEGYEVVVIENGIKAVETYQQQRFNLIILDIMLPGLNGLEVCEKIRVNNSNIPILILSAKDESEDKIKGLKKGADDYLAKPFNLEELLLRVKILLKRSAQVDQPFQEMEIFNFGEHQINFNTYEAKANSKQIKLTKKEAMLLKLLISRKNQVVSREQIMQHVWGYDVFPTTRTVDNFIANFRKYFEKDIKAPQYFQSVRGVGYKFVIENF